MTDTLAPRLVNLAFDMGLSIRETVVLPTVVSLFAKKTMMTKTAMVTELERNAELREYAAEMCALGAEAL